MVAVTLPETEDQIKTPAIFRLVAILDRLPAEERAEVWQGIALNLAAHLHAERKGIGAR